jgi:hypothetical protein
MMGLLEAALGFIALVAVLGALHHWLPPRDPPAPEVDLAAPYREGLYAAIRMQVVAQDLEQQMYAEAARHTSKAIEAGGEPDA